MLVESFFFIYFILFVFLYNSVVMLYNFVVDLIIVIFGKKRKRLEENGEMVLDYSVLVILSMFVIEEGLCLIFLIGKNLE